MIITFFSNYLTHHQIPFCRAMDKREGVEFHFVSTMPMEEEREKGGWKLSNAYPFELRSYASWENERQALKLAAESDVVIIGAASEKYVRYRMKYAQSKLTLRYAERIYKKGRWRAFSPHSLVSNIRKHLRYMGKPIYVLCASAYTAGDFALLGSYLGKCYKWGYFPETKKYDEVEKITDSKRPSSILWVARLIDWKHPEIAVEVAKKLKDNGYIFSLNLIGIGPLEEKIKGLIENYGLQKEVKMLGSMTPEEVREEMEKSSIFLFTSDREEGWGAVLNEAMNSACAVVANRQIGSVPFLIDDGKNGLIYGGNNVEKIYRKVKSLLDDGQFAKAIGVNAYKTISEEWNAEIASDRLVSFVKSEKYKRNRMYDKGPCSRA